MGKFVTILSSSVDGDLERRPAPTRVKTLEVARISPPNALSERWSAGGFTRRRSRSGSRLTPPGERRLSRFGDLARLQVVAVASREFRVLVGRLSAYGAFNELFLRG
jgi:hypothetical protein